MKKFFAAVMGTVLVLILSCGITACAEEYKLTLLQEGGLPHPYCSENEPDGIRDKIKDALTNSRTAFEVYASDMSADELARTYEDVINHSPKLYYVTGTVDIEETDGGYMITPSYKNDDITLSSISDQSSMSKAIDDILAQVKPGMSDVEKILAVHDYIVLNYEYDLTYSIYDDEEFFRNKRGVCQAYTMAFGAIMDELNIKWEYVISDAMDHAWNMVYLDGEWYHVDVTWDDPVNDTYGYVRHEFLLLSDDAISDDAHEHHDWETGDYWESQSVLRATSTKYDDYFWSYIYEPMQYYNGSWYLCSDWWNENIPQGLSKYDFSTGDFETLINEDIRKVNIYNNYIYFLCEDIVYMSPLNDPTACVSITEFAMPDKCNGVHIGDGHLYYAIAEDEYYMQRGDTFDGKALYDDYYDYRKLYSIDLTQYKYNELAPSWNLDEESGTLTVSVKSGIIPDYGYMNAPWKDRADEVKEIVIEEGVKEIGNNAFANMTNVKKLSLPSTLEVIGDRAFEYYSSLKMITIPDNVTDIGKRAFQYCYGLVLLKIGENVTHIGEYAFSDCESLKCITIGKNIKDIERYAFAYNYNISDVFYSGSEQDFEEIGIGYSNKYLIGANITYGYKAPILTRVFEEGDDLIIFELQSNEAVLGEPIPCSLKICSSSGLENYSYAQYIYDTDAFKIDNGTVYALRKGKENISVKVGDETVSFDLYIGERKNKDMRVYLSEGLFPFVASYDANGALLKLTPLDAEKLNDTGIEYMDYGGKSKFMVWDGGFSAMKPAGSTVDL